MDKRKLGMELLGTFFLVLTISTVSGGLAPIAIGLALTIMVYIGGNISGAHYNPAVSLAIFLRGKMPVGDLVPYVVAQCIGGLAAALIGFMITHTAPVIQVAGGVTAVQVADAEQAMHEAMKNALGDLGKDMDKGASKGQSRWAYVHGAMAAEFLYTFMLALVVLTVATTKKHANNPYYGVCIGGTVMCAAFAVGGISGGAFNPAVGLSLSIVGLFGKASAFQWFWIYLIFPFLGAICAVMAFKFLHPDEIEGPKPTLSSAIAAAKASVPAPAPAQPPTPPAP